MSIGIYRNRLNQDMKRFSRLAKTIDSSDGTIVFEDKRDVSLRTMKEFDTVIFITHGSATQLFHRWNEDPNYSQVLLDVERMEILRNKKVVALSCGTARELGPKACSEGGCIVYLGFRNRIHFNRKDKSLPSNIYKSFLSDCYKEVFGKVFRLAIINSWSFDKLKDVLERELSDEVRKRALKIKEKHPRYYEKHGLDQAIIAVTDVVNNLYIFGDGEQIVS